MGSEFHARSALRAPLMEPSSVETSSAVEDSVQGTALPLQEIDRL